MWEMSYGAQRYTPLLSTELYAIVVPPTWAMRALLERLTTVGAPVGRAGSWPGWL